MNAVEPQELKQEFENTSPSWLGVTVIAGRHQDPKAIPVAPGNRVFLTREEQILTSRAHQRDEDSPFNQGLRPVSAPGAVSEDRRVPFDDTPEVEITGAEPQPAGETGVGVQAAEEITGTPAPTEPPKPARAAAPKPAPSPPKPLTAP